MNANDKRALILLREWSQLDIAMTESAKVLTDMGIEDDGSETGIPEVDAILDERYDQWERQQDIEWLFRKWVEGEDLIMAKLQLDKLLNRDSL